MQGTRFGTRFGTKGFGTTRSGQAPLSLFVSCLCVLLLAAGCSKSEKSDGTLDTSRLPRVAGAKEVFASPASTIFTTPNPVAQTADTVDKALATEGWQKYVAPNTSLLASDSQRSLSLKKGPFALGVFITVAPAQGNATSVQYNAVTLKNDVPFPKDASNIEFDPNKPLLMLLSAEPIDKTLEFYRQELAPLGWSLWSQKLNGVQPSGGASGELTKSGAYAYYLQGDRRLAALVLETAEAGRTKVKFEELPSGYLETLQKEFFNSDNIGAALVDVGRLPRLDGAKEDTTRSSKSPRSIPSRARSRIRSLPPGNCLRATAGRNTWHRSMRTTPCLRSKRDRKDCRCRSQSRWARTTRPARSPPFITRRPG